MLGRLQISVRDCITTYLEMSKEVFGAPQNITRRERFSPEALESVIRTVVQKTTGQEEAPLMDRDTCKTSMPTCMVESLMLTVLDLCAPSTRKLEGGRPSSFAPTRPGLLQSTARFGKPLEQLPLRQLSSRRSSFKLGVSLLMPESVATILPRLLSKKQSRTTALKDTLA